MSELRDKNGLTEAEFLKAYNPGDWRKPSLTADICIISVKDNEDRILLIRRGNHPFLGKWALPGGFSEAGECIEDTAARELMEETCISMPSQELTLVGIYSKPGRDAADDAADAGWFTIIRDTAGWMFKKDEIELSRNDLAFDHYDIISDALKRR